MANKKLFDFPVVLKPSNISSKLPMKIGGKVEIMVGQIIALERLIQKISFLPVSSEIVKPAMNHFNQNMVEKGLLE